MKTIFLYLTLIFSLNLSCDAQGKFGIEPVVGFGFGINNFTNDSLVFPNRRSESKLPAFMQAALLARMKCNDNGWVVLAGAGYRWDELVINRDKSFSFDFLSGGSASDTFSVRSIGLESSSIIFPFGIEYNFKSKLQRRHHLVARLLVMPGHRLHVHGYVHNDSLNQVTYPVNNQQIIDEYTQASSDFSLTIIPQLYFNLRLWKPNLFMNVSLVPIAIDVVDIYRRFIKPGINFMPSVSMAYQF